MKLEKNNLVIYNGHQMTVIATYSENNIDYVDLRQGKKKKFFKVPVERVYFIAKKQTKYLN